MRLLSLVPTTAVIALATSVVLSGCNTASDASGASDSPARSGSAGEEPSAQVVGDVCVDLMAGQHTVAGTVCATVDADSVRVIYQTTGGWTLVETHLWAGLDVAELGKGGIALGRFPWTAEGLGDVTSHSEAIPLSRFGVQQGGDVCPSVMAELVAHAVVEHPSEGRETAYGSGTRLSSKGNWAMWFGLPLVCTGAPVDPPGGDTVAVAPSCFSAWGRTDASVSFLHQLEALPGWVNGPYQGGEYLLPLRSAQGDSVGRVRLVYEGPEMVVQFTVSAGMVLDETHVYVGSSRTPVDGQGLPLAAPGLYPSVHLGLPDPTTDAHSVPGIDGDQYAAAHAVVCPIAP